MGGVFVFVFMRGVDRCQTTVFPCSQEGWMGADVWVTAFTGGGYG